MIKRKAFLFTTGDGRPTANAFWMPEHQKIIPKVENVLERQNFEPVWLHDKSVAVNSPYMAMEVGKKLLEKMAPTGDLLIDLTTGWNFPEHFGIVVTMAQKAIFAENLNLLLVCNMKEKAPGYVAARANALICEIMELPYTCLTVLDQSYAGWADLGQSLREVLAGSYNPDIPETEIEINVGDRRIATEAISMLRKSGGVVPLVNANSMTMAQGWPNYYMFKRLGLTPIFIGSNQFRADMDAVSASDVVKTYSQLREMGLQFIFEENGLCEKEVFDALRMYLAKLDYFKRGAIGMGTQGQMDTTKFEVATDLSESLMMTSRTPFKTRPVIDVTEGDCEALWTSLLMQYILKVKYGGDFKPIGFHDVRHYNRKKDTLVLLNSGALSFDFLTDKAGDYSDIKVVSQNRDVYFLNGGACVMGNMRKAENANMFRAHGKGKDYRMLATPIDFLFLSWEERERNYGKLDPWPMGITRIKGGKTKAVTLNWIPNHSQHCNEDIMGPMKAACEILGVEFYCF